MIAAAVLLIFLGLSSINGVLVVLDSPITFGIITQPIMSLFSDDQFTIRNSMQDGTNNEVQRVVIDVKTNGYSPNRVQVKVGIPVQLTLQTKNTYSCASSFILKAFNIKLRLASTDSQTVSFTPTQKGKYQFTCSMGMYTGILEVI